LIVYVWVAATLWLPCIGEKERSLSVLFAETVQRSLFYFAITLPFDIRDEEIDRNANLKTLAATFGLYYTKLTACCCLYIASFIAYLSFTGMQFLAITISHLLCFFLVIGVHKNRKLVYYTGWMDGTIIFQAILLFFAKAIS
ncbi:MAG: hypothetical protein AAGI07_17090, partial [Bacteroidota bacterium]